jgi:MFS family permease
MTQELTAGPSIFRDHNFRQLFNAHLVSEIGSQISMVALPLVALLTLDANPFQVGLLYAAQTAAFAVFGLPAGVWVDRLPRKPVLITADVARAALLGSVPLAWATGHLTLFQLYVVALCSSTATVFFDVAYQSYLPTLVGQERLIDGNSKLEVVHSTAQIGGPGVGGWLINLVSAPAAIIADALSFVGSAVFIRRISAPEPRRSEETSVQKPQRSSLASDMRDGLRFVFGNPTLRVIAIRSSLANLAFSAITSLQTVFLVQEVGISPGFFGTLVSAGAVGGLVGGFLVGPLSERIGSARLIWVAPLVCQPFALLIPLSGRGVDLGYFVIGMFVLSIGVVLYNVSQLSFRQRITPDHMLGRMNATMRFVVWGTMPIGSLVGGFLGQTWGVRASLWVCIGALITSVLPLLLSPMVRQRDLPDVPKPAE